MAAIEQAATQSFDEENLPDEAPSPLAEQWPYLRFLGLGVWWAWIWLCYFSTRLVGQFPTDIRPSLVLQMYLISTVAIGLTMLAAGVANRFFTRLIDSRGPVLVAGALASAATLALAFSCQLGGPAPFAIAAVVTGMGTGALCMKVGRLYGTISLSDSLTAGAVSLVLAALLFFVGLGIPDSWAIFYVAALPLLAAVLLCMRWDDPYGGLPQLRVEKSYREETVRHLYVRLAVAAMVVALTAGVARGISSSLQAVENYGHEGAAIVAVIGLIGVLLAWLVNRFAAQRKGARVAYMALMIAGVALMLATCFGFPISSLSVGKESLWLVFTCLMAFMAFRFGFSSVRAFALGQAAYFLASAAGWAVGALIAPFYDDATVRMAVGAAMAFAVVLVFTFLFTERHISEIVMTPVVPAYPSAAVAGAVVGAAPMAGAESGQPDAPVVSAEEQRAQAQRERLAKLEGAFGLSAREVEIMDLFAQGRSANWIADALFISKNTVRSHLRTIYSKVNVHTRQELLDTLASLNCE
ncbi:MAG: helix-turn-helix transcriptional regulator [Eggerthellaceae bacterium]|nr:helix-turn-helix transcriptional regulator [Eggerthellaceae bacterium]